MLSSAGGGSAATAAELNAQNAQPHSAGGEQTGFYLDEAVEAAQGAPTDDLK